MASSPPPSPLHRRQSSNFSNSSSKRLSQTMSFSRRSSAAFGSSHGPGGGGDSLALELGGEEFGESLADELDGYSDDDALEEEDEGPAEQERDSGIDVASSPPEGGKHLSPQSATKQAGHRRKESAYDGSEYGSESDLEETELVSASLEARMAAVEAMARRGLEENGSDGDKVVGRLTERLRDLGSQSEMEMTTTRLSTAYTALSTHLTNQTRILSQLTSHFMSPVATIYISPQLLEEIEPFIEETLTSISTLHPTSRPPQAIHTLLAETADLIQDLNYLKDTLQVNQQTTTVGSRKLRAVKDLLRDAREDMNRRDESVRWIEQGCWDQRLRQRDAERECSGILQGFEQVCEGWGERIKAQVVTALLCHLNSFHLNDPEINDPEILLADIQRDLHIRDSMDRREEATSSSKLIEHKMNVNQTVQAITSLHQHIEGSPYSNAARTRLAKAYQAAGYPDLAAGEAYLALLLVDEALGETGEFEDEAYEAAVFDYWEERGERVPSGLPETKEPRDSDDDDDDERDEGVIAWIRGPVKDGIYALLVENLIACNNLKQASDYIKCLSAKATGEAQRLQNKLEAAVKSHFKYEKVVAAPEELPEWGRVRREVYPWNDHEPDRSSQQSFTSLNELLATAAPKLEARITELPDLTKPGSEGTVKQIGLFAKQDIPPGEQVLHEKSILTATARLNDTFCDACAAKLSLKGVISEGEPSSCPECYETIFCSPNCLQLAQVSYHPALCGKDITSLGKDAEAKDAAHALYALLLLRAFALAEHQDMHPLDLLQTKYLWGDFTSVTPSLPFNLHFNAILPLTMLEKMEIDIFSSSTRFNTWTFNTLFAKFRGTADARQGPDGKPEIGAVHPLWCLANHSCDPNVRWEWEGHMSFWTRTKAQSVHWQPESGERGEQGLRRNEEVLGHYCDVELDVVERREWARGALGGDCMCKRCVWEAGHPELVKKVRIER